MTAPQDEPVAWEVEFGNGEVELWSVKDHSSEPAFGEIVTALYAQSPSAVRAAAIAECARVCEEWGNAKVAKWSGTELETDAKSRAWDGLQCAAAIRALAQHPQISDCVPCRHEWYQGACVHCEMPASEFRALSPRPTVSDEWIDTILTNLHDEHDFSRESAIRARNEPAASPAAPIGERDGH